MKYLNDMNEAQKAGKKMEVVFKRVGTSYYNILVDGELKGKVFKASIGFRNYTHWRYFINGTEDAEPTLKTAKARIQQILEK